VNNSGSSLCPLASQRLPAAGRASGVADPVGFSLSAKLYCTIIVYNCTLLIYARIIVGSTLLAWRKQ
jgi:hypothetical protein